MNSQERAKRLLKITKWLAGGAGIGETVPEDLSSDIIQLEIIYLIGPKSIRLWDSYLKSAEEKYLPYGDLL